MKAAPRSTLALALGAALLAGCGSDGPLGPVGGRGSAAGAQRGPTPSQYTVRRGETLGGIARNFGLEPAEVARLNGISDPNLVRVGQVLRLPRSSSGPEVAFQPPPTVPPSWSASPGAQAQVQGQPQERSRPVPETMTPPAQPFSRSVSVVALDPPPAPLPSAPTPAAPTPRVPTRAGPVPGDAMTAAPARQTAALTDLPPRDPLPPATGTLPSGPNRDRHAGRFAWPADGAIVSEYGTQSGGLHNDGINISAPRGAAVRAAGDGVIAYTGNELRGFGNLILVRHENGWVTAYAHLDRMLVRRGETVRRGQQIGTVGSTGAITTPQLHFEVRRGSRAADPREFLEPRSGVRRAAGPGARQDPG